MKLWRPFLTIIFCSTLAVGFGLVGCGGDDGEPVPPQQPPSQTQGIELTSWCLNKMIIRIDGQFVDVFREGKTQKYSCDPGMHTIRVCDFGEDYCTDIDRLVMENEFVVYDVECTGTACWVAWDTTFCYAIERICRSGCEGFAYTDCQVACTDGIEFCTSNENAAFLDCLAVDTNCFGDCEESILQGYLGFDCGRCLGVHEPLADNCEQIVEACSPDCSDLWFDVDYTEWLDCRYDCGAQIQSCWNSVL